MLLSLHGPIESLVARQLETLQTLCAHWLNGRRHHEMSVTGFARLEDRIAAHVDALFLAGQAADDLIIPGLGQGTAAEDFGGAMPLLQGDTTRAEPVWRALLTTPTAELGGLLHALRRGPIEPLENQLSAAPAELAPVAGLTLRTHGRSGPPPGNVAVWRQHEEPIIRAIAWELTGLQPGFPPASEFGGAATDEDAEVRHAAYEAAFRAQPAWLAGECRRHAIGDPVALAWFVALTKPEDEAFWHEIAATPALGFDRFVAMGGTGLLALGELLLTAMDGPPDQAVAALAGYRRLTGARSLPTIAVTEEAEGDFGLERTLLLPDVPGIAANFREVVAGRRRVEPADDMRTAWERPWRVRG